MSKSMLGSINARDIRYIYILYITLHPQLPPLSAAPPHHQYEYPTAKEHGCCLHEQVQPFELGPQLIHSHHGNH